MLDEIIKNKLKEVSQLKSSFDISKIDFSVPKSHFMKLFYYVKVRKKIQS